MTIEPTSKLHAVLLVALIFGPFLTTPPPAAGWSAEFSLAQWHAAVTNSTDAASHTTMKQYVAGFRDAYAWAQTEILRSSGGSAKEQSELFRRATDRSTSELLIAALTYHPDENPSVALQKTLDYLTWNMD